MEALRRRNWDVMSRDGGAVSRRGIPGMEGEGGYDVPGLDVPLSEPYRAFYTCFLHSLSLTFVIGSNIFTFSTFIPISLYLLRI